MKKLLFSLLVFGLFAATSCNKNTNTNTKSNALNTPPQVNTPSDAYGVLGVIRVQTSYTTPVSVPGVTFPPVDFNMGTAIAYFTNSAGATTFVDAGNVSVSDSVLTKSSENSYAFTPKGTPDGSDLGIATSGVSNYNWNISGSSNVPAFNKSLSGVMPVMGRITSSDNVTTSSSYTISLPSVPTNCDSVIWVMIGPSGSVNHITIPQLSYTFSAAEVGTLGKGDNIGIVQAAAYRVTDFTQNSKKYYYIRETCSTKSVSLK